MCFWKHFDKQSRVRMQHKFPLLSYENLPCLLISQRKKLFRPNFNCYRAKQLGWTQGKLAWLPLRHTKTCIPLETAKTNFALVLPHGQDNYKIHPSFRGRHQGLESSKNVFNKLDYSTASYIPTSHFSTSNERSGQLPSVLSETWIPGGKPSSLTCMADVLLWVQSRT